MKPDAIRRYVTDETVDGGHTEIGDGHWCRFDDVEALVDAIVHDLEKQTGKVLAMEGEQTLLSEQRRTSNNLLAHDIKLLLYFPNGVMPNSRARLESFVLAVERQ